MKMFEKTSDKPREYTREEHEASLKRLADSWGLEGAGYTAALHERLQASVLGSALREAGSENDEEDVKSLFKLLDHIDRLVDLLG